MDFEEVRRIIKLMDEHQLVEFEIEEGGKKIKLRKADGKLVAVPASAAMAMAHNIASAAPATPPASSEHILEFKSPLVGTFYRTPKPDVEPFVKEGDEVNPESVLCIIEAMKVMNEIKAEVSGVIKEIRAKNGQAVEFGETLFVIEKK